MLGLYVNYVFVSFTKVSSWDYLNSQNKEKTKINYLCSSSKSEEREKTCQTI